MSEPGKNPFDLLLDQIREVVRDEIKAASSAGQQRKLLFTTKETAAMLNVEQSWLATRARAGKIPHRMLGHYRYFLKPISILSLQRHMYPWYTVGMTSKQFKKARKALGMSQGQLAKLLEVTVTSVARWERGERPISGPVALAMKLLLEKK